MRRLAIGYAATVFLSAFLLFAVQPLIGRYILPWFGGTPAVWTTCLLFFQVLLLAGYAYAHALSRLPGRAQAVVHLGLVAGSLLLLPIAPVASWRPTGGEVPVRHILGLLAVCVGGPYIVLSATGPLLQHWFSRTRPDGAVYRLFALSNAGSLLALVSYPFVFEPAMHLGDQARAWGAAYVVFGALMALCAVGLFRAPREAAAPEAAPGEAGRPGPGVVALWIALSAMGSVMLLSTTNQLCQEVAVVPFLWVLPLCLYLCSFVIAFDGPRWYDRRVFGPLLVLVMPGTLWVYTRGYAQPLVVQVILYGLGLFAACMVLHGELARIKPEARYLTRFYLLVSGGGALGAVTVAQVAPATLSGYWEFPVGLLVTVILVLFVWTRDGVWRAAASSRLALAWTQATIVVGATAALLLAQLFGRHTAVEVVVAACPLALVLALAWRDSPDSATFLRRGAWLWAPLITLACLMGVEVGRHVASRSDRAVAALRNFYGVVRVDEQADFSGRRYRSLVHGRIDHGRQFRDPALAKLPTAYFGRKSGVGLALRLHPAREERPLRVGCVGLGIGVIATYGRPGDRYRFYEINPAVIRLAHSEFTYLRDTKADVEIAQGDGRIVLDAELRRGGGNRFDVLVLDAVSSDAIPLHLLTVEAVRIYVAHLAEGGVLAINISSNLVELGPVVRGLAAEVGRDIRRIENLPSIRLGVSVAHWVLITNNQALLSHPAVVAAQTTRDVSRPPLLWTDDFASLWQVIR